MPKPSEQALWFGHVVTAKGTLTNTTPQGTIEGKYHSQLDSGSTHQFLGLVSVNPSVFLECFYLWAVVSVECFLCRPMQCTQLNVGIVGFRNIMEEDKKKRLMVSMWHKDSQKK